MQNRARILVVTGPGKGKTTSATGIILRSVAHGRKVLLSRFAKSTRSGELDILEKLPGVSILSSGRGMTPPPDHSDYPLHVAAARELFDKTIAAAPSVDLVVMDEICGITSRNMIAEEEVTAFLDTLRSDQVAVLTGRNAGLCLLAAADTVSEVRDVKHGYTRGINAQSGVEY